MDDYEVRKLSLTDQYDYILVSNEKNVLVREVAKTVAMYGVVIGEKKLWNILREWGLIFKNSTEPMQAGINRRFFVIVEGVKITNAYRIPFHTTRVTPKGQQYILSRLVSGAHNKNVIEINSSVKVEFLNK